MNEKFNKNAKVEKLTKKLGRGVRQIVIGPLKITALECTAAEFMHIYKMNGCNRLTEKFAHFRAYSNLFIKLKEKH